eukprot:3229569-Prymnesium_polylepis.1
MSRATVQIEHRRADGSRNRTAPLELDGIWQDFTSQSDYAVWTLDHLTPGWGLSTSGRHPSTILVSVRIPAEEEEARSGVGSEHVGHLRPAKKIKLISLASC